MNPVRLDSLTGLRFVAALGVAFVHLPYLHSQDGLGRVLAEGGIGVPFFFILSGFVLTLAYRERLANPSRTALTDYYVARIARVWPLHLVTLALAFVLPVGPQSAALGPALANAFLVQTWLPDARYLQSFNSVSWTLSIEAFFYATLPLLLRLMLRWKSASARQWTLVAVGIWSVQYAWVSWHLSGADVMTLYRVSLCPASRIGEFIIGMCLAFAFARESSPINSHRPTWSAIEFALVFVLVALMARADRTHPLLRTSVYYVPVLAAIVAVFARSRGALSQALAGRGPVILGEISFAFFLIHPFAFIHIGNRIAMPYGPTACAIVSLSSALVAALVMNRWIEVPLRTAIPKWIANRGLGSPRSEGSITSASRQPTYDRRRRASPPSVVPSST